MRYVHKLLIVGVASVVFAGVLSASAQQKEKASPTTPTTAAAPPKQEPSLAEKRAEIDTMAKAAMDDLFSKSASAKTLYQKAYGWAVFDNLKLAFLFTGGGGKGVAVLRSDPTKRVYMSMGTAGVGIGIGAHKSQIIFLFETKQALDKFVYEGWTATAEANAVGGKSGANAEATFQNGMAFYQITEKGLMLQADISGTKYWKDDELNIDYEHTNK